MALKKEFKSARRLIQNAIRARGYRRAVEEGLSTHPWPSPGSIKIVVYFADARVNLYQLRQWYAPLAELSRTWPVAILARSPSATLPLWDEAPIPTVNLRSVGQIEEFLAQHDVQIVFYVNQNTKNFQMFRYGRMWHVFINHGESDKMYMTTNQFKAYDYSFIAGDAARERLSSRLWAFDLDSRTRSIGRPQADHFAGPLPYTPDDRTVVLYAPTWEGDRGAAAYGSIASHGVALASAVLASPSHRLIYRPHPRSGVLDPEYRAANQSIIEAIARTNAADPGAQHVFDDGPELGWQLVAADVAISDISAMVYDRLATGKPLLITRPVSEFAEIDESGYLGACEWLVASDASNVLSAVDAVLTDPDALATLKYWVARHFGDTTPGVATARFRAAVQELSDLWLVESKVHERDRVERGSVSFDDDGDDGRADEEQT